MKRLKPTVLLLAAVLVSGLVTGVEAQYVFEDGFEGTDEAWTEVSNPDLNCAARVHHGSEASESQIVSAAGSNYSYAVLGSTYTELYARSYINIDELSGTGQCRGTLTLANEQGGTICGLRIDGADRSVIIEYMDGTLQTLDNNSMILSLDTWYCIEVYAYCDNSAGEARLWVDESLTHNVTGIDTVIANKILDRVTVGCGYAWPTTRVYCDCVVVDSSYIGPEAGGETYNVNPTVSLTFSLASTQTFWGTYILNPSVNLAFSLASSLQKVSGQLFNVNPSVNMVFSLSSLTEAFKTYSVTQGINLVFALASSVQRMAGQLFSVKPSVVLQFVVSTVENPFLVYQIGPSVVVNFVVSSTASMVLHYFKVQSLVNLIFQLGSTSIIVVPTGIEDAIGLAALAFILALVGIALVFTYTSKRA